MSDGDLSGIAASAARAAGCETAILLVRDARGRIGFFPTGVASHAEAVQIMASGIHLALTDHDRHVLAGAAGAEAQAVARSCLEEG